MSQRHWREEFNLVGNFRVAASSLPEDGEFFDVQSKSFGISLIIVNFGSLDSNVGNFQDVACRVIVNVLGVVVLVQIGGDLLGLVDKVVCLGDFGSVYNTKVSEDATKNGGLLFAL